MPEQTYLKMSENIDNIKRMEDAGASAVVDVRTRIRIGRTNAR